MHSNHIDILQSLVNSSERLGEEEKQHFLDEIQALKKQIAKTDFKYTRIKMDRKIVEKALNSSIEDMEKNQMQIEQINAMLSIQRDELKRQKQIIEEKSSILADNLKQLEYSYKEMEQFAYIASHDLKSPLRTISNFAQLLKRRNYDKLDDASRDFIDYIVAGTKQMHEVICDSLEYSRVGKEEQSFQRADLTGILETVQFNLKKEIDENDAVIVTDQLPVMKANKTSLLQLFQNLISNAIKFKGQEDPLINISCEKYENGYKFKVTDNGAGMDESFQEKAFLPFQRLNDRHKPGSGIGLAICKKIVNMHDGNIRYESERGKGTTFIFTLFNKSNKEKDSTK